MEKKKLIIVGGGIAGLSCGIYALENGFDVTIYEKHVIPGGQCTGWDRNGSYIDGCAHWIVGTNRKSQLYPLWRHVGAITENTIIHDTEYFCKYDIEGDIITFYADLVKLENELLRVAPEDKKGIRKFIKDIKAYQHVQIPTHQPIDTMNIFQLTALGIKLLPMATRFTYLQSMSVDEYATKRFKSKKLRKLFSLIIRTGYNSHSLIYIMQGLSKKDAGMIEGGSRKIAFDIAKVFKDKGGILKTNQNVEKILVEDNTAVGILCNGEEIRSDYVVSTTDIHHTLFDLLEEKYAPKYFMDKFNDFNSFPFQAGLLFAFKANKNINHLPKMNNFAIQEPIAIGDFIIHDLTMRNHAFDKTINKKSITSTMLVDVPDSVYHHFKNLSKEDYKKEKERIGSHVLKEVKQYFNFNDEDISLLDFATPLTHERYTNAYHGSYMSFLTTNKARGIMGKNYIKGLKNFALAGQWVMPPGGLPIALFTGKHAVYRICLYNKQKFIDLDEKFN